MAGRDGRAYHRSDRAKEYVADKIAALAALSFMRTPPSGWTGTQRAAFDAWYPGGLAVAEEMIADARFPDTLRRLGIVHAVI